MSPFFILHGWIPSGQTSYNLLRDHPNKSCTHLTPCIGIRILLPMFPLHYFISPWLFGTCQFVLLNPFTIFYPSFQPSSYLAIAKMFPVIYESISVLLVHLFCFLDSIIDRYMFIVILFFIVLIFLFFLKSAPVIFNIIMVWWWWTTLVFSCMGSSLSAFPF